MFDIETELVSLKNIAERFNTEYYFSIEDRLREKIDIDEPHTWFLDKIRFSNSVHDLDLKHIIARVIVLTMLGLIKNFEKYGDNPVMMNFLTNIDTINIYIVHLDDLKFQEDAKQIFKNHIIKLEMLARHS